MKKKYVTPTMVGERFSADEYVAACITGTIQCVYPGTSTEKGDNGKYDDYNQQESGWYRDASGLLHGVCGNDATITFNDNIGRGFEKINGVIQKDRPIYNISGYKKEPGTYLGVKWNSTDGKNEYTHIGRLEITNIDENHPNHS